MKSKKLRRRLKKELERLEKNAALIPYSEGNMEVVHRFRVVYKKMKTIVGLCHKKRSGKAVKIPSGLKTIYHQTGKVRSLQLYYSSVSQYFNKSNRYLFQVLKNIAPHKRRLSQIISKVNLHKAVKSIAGRVPKRIPNKMLKKFIHQKAKLVRSVLWQTAISDRELHTVRKNLKDIIHTANLFSCSLPKGLKAIGITDQQGLRRFTDLLNDHQDYVDGINILRNTPFSNVTDTNRAALYEIFAKWKQNKRLLAHRIQNRKIIIQQT